MSNQKRIELLELQVRCLEISLHGIIQICEKLTDYNHLNNDNVGLIIKALEILALRATNSPDYHLNNLC